MTTWFHIHTTTLYSTLWLHYTCVIGVRGVCHVLPWEPGRSLQSQDNSPGKYHIHEEGWWGFCSACHHESILNTNPSHWIQDMHAEIYKLVTFCRPGCYIQHKSTVCVCVFYQLTVCSKSLTHWVKTNHEIGIKIMCSTCRCRHSHLLLHTTAAPMAERGLRLTSQ